MLQRLAHHPTLSTPLFTHHSNPRGTTSPVPGSPGGARKTLYMRGVADIDEETVGSAVAKEAAQEGLPRRIAAHEFGAAGGVRLGVEVDGWFHTPQGMVPGIGFEPTTYALRMRRSTN